MCREGEPMLTKTIRALLCLILLAASAPVWSLTPADYAWAAGHPRNVSTVTWTSEQIGEFLARATGSDIGYAVGDFAFVDLLGNGNLELVATIDTNGRGFFNDLLVVRRGSAGIAIQTIPVLSMQSLAGAIFDLNGDGMRELIVPKPLTPYLGGAVDQAAWTAVYAWTGALFEERTSAFAAWYAANVLPGLQEALSGAQQSGDSIAIALAQLQLDKAIRASGGTADTGFIFARTLAGSASPQLRIWAASALADIGTPAALGALSTLIRDGDARVRIFAKAAQDQSALDHCERVGIAVVSGGPEH